MQVEQIEIELKDSLSNFPSLQSFIWIHLRSVKNVERILNFISF